MSTPSALLAAAALVFSIGDAGPAQDPRDPVSSLRDFEVHEGLEVTLFASEPMIASPTNLDIDHRGRVWVCEVLNYHRNRGRRKEGDRILILEDTDADGRADHVKVFHQGKDIDSAMGICVLGERVIVTASPNVFIFTDTDGDDRADRREVLFTKTGHPEHDHSAHSFVFGPDGKLYWNFGNTGQGVHDPSGDVVVDLLGHHVLDTRSPYQGGMVFRCNLDGSAFEVLGHNFRNNYEGAVDSFGTVWQTDNDDDGNRGARMSYVMEGGNFGYRDELTGASWKTPRTGQHQDVSSRHFHQNDPGVVPNLIVTGNGAPSGITVYEGRLLPEVFHDTVLHGDTVSNTVYGNVIERDGAGFRGKAIPLLRSRKDRWFRPVDVCVAPDGSVFVTDWYDPGVGGHRQADTARGRIYRIAPPGRSYRTPGFDFSTISGVVEALKSPNAAVRYLAWSALHARGDNAVAPLTDLFSSSNSRFRARALWLLGKIDGLGKRWIDRALRDEDPAIRIVGIRLARQLALDVLGVVSRMARDPSAAVRRECAIALRETKGLRASTLWVKLARQHGGTDRWYLEALGIGADRLWEERFDAWLASVGQPDRSDSAVRDLLWRSRSRKALPHLGELIRDPSTPPEERLRYFRAFDFHDDPSKDRVLRELEDLGAPFATLARRHRQRRAHSSTTIIESVVSDRDRSASDRRLAIEMHAGSPQAEQSLLAMLRDGKIPPNLHLAAANVLLHAEQESVRTEAARLLKLPRTADRKPVPTPRELEGLQGDAARGRLVYDQSGKCSTCHMVRGQGKPLGPDLSTIGGKLSRYGLAESILFPSLAISHGYEALVAVTKKGEVILGVLQQSTDDDVTLVPADGIPRLIRKKDLRRLRRHEESLMPAALYGAMTRQELIDLVEFLTTLRE